MCAQLPVEISFCQAYAPEGKGKIEKHYGTIKDGFYKEAEHAGLTTLDDLNKFFWAWLTREYHREIHSSLNMTPLERWRKDEHLIKRVSPEDVRRALMLKANRKVNRRTATIRLENKYFQASADLAGSMVEIRWQAGLPDSIEIWLDGKLVEIAKATTIGTNIDFTKKPETERIREKPGLPLSSSKNYRNTLVKEHQGEAPSFSLPEIKDDFLSQVEFLLKFSQALNRELEPEEQSLLSQFFFENSPLRTNKTEALVLQAVNAKGTQLHLRYYLEHIRTSIFKTRR